MRKLTLTGIALVAVALVAACSDSGVVAPGEVANDGPPAIRADHLPNMVCEVVDFEGFTHGDAITSVNLPLIGETLTFTATRNVPAGAVNATAYNTDYTQGDGGCTNLLNNTHEDTQIPASTGLESGLTGFCAECDGMVMMVPDVDFCVDSDDSQGGFITIGFPAGDWEIPSYDAVDRDDAAPNTILRVGAGLVQVGTTNCPANAACGNGEVVTVLTTDHTFTGSAQFENQGSGGIDDIEICKDFPPPPGGDGCTPGYWKVRPHLDSWPPTGFSPNQQFSSVFENAFPGMTLREVLSQGGGGLKALGRHTVAALLNAAHPDVAYDLTTVMVINQFNAVFPGGDYEAQKDFFEGFNEQGCPIN